MCPSYYYYFFQMDVLEYFCSTAVSLQTPCSLVEGPVCSLWLKYIPHLVVYCTKPVIGLMLCLFPHDFLLCTLQLFYYTGCTGQFLENGNSGLRRSLTLIEHRDKTAAAQYSVVYFCHFDHFVDLSVVTPVLQNSSTTLCFFILCDSSIALQLTTAFGYVLVLFEV